MKQLRLIIIREYLTKVRNKSFLLMTFLSPLAVVTLSLLIGYLTQLNNSTQRHIEVLDESGYFQEIFQKSPNLSVSYHKEGDLEQLKQTARSENAYGLLYIDKQAAQFQFLSEEPPSVTFVESLQGKLEKGLFRHNLEAASITPSQIDGAQQRVSIALANFSGDESSQTLGWLKLAFGGTAGYLLMMFIIIYGNMVMRSVIEEKVNRIMEVIVSSVRPSILLLGKIIGTSLVGLTQFVIWVVIAGFLFSFLSSPMATEVAPTSDPHFLTNIITEINSLPLAKLLISFFLFFIGGYLTYSAFFATIGAAVDSETDTQQFLFPVLLPLILAIYIGFFTVIEDPHGVVSVIFSYIPLTSSVVMLMRIPFGVSWGEIILSLALLIWVSARIYRIGILSYGKKPSYKELIKWLRMPN